MPENSALLGQVDVSASKPVNYLLGVNWLLNFITFQKKLALDARLHNQNLFEAVDH